MSDTKTKFCSKVHRNECLVGKVEQPMDQFVSTKQNKETKICLTCRRHIQKLKTQSRRDKAMNSNINQWARKKIEPGTAPVFYQDSRDRYYEWLRYMRALVDDPAKHNG